MNVQKCGIADAVRYAIRNCDNEICFSDVTNSINALRLELQKIHLINKGGI